MNKFDEVRSRIAWDNCSKIGISLETEEVGGWPVDIVYGFSIRLITTFKKTAWRKRE